MPTTAVSVRIVEAARAHGAFWSEVGGLNQSALEKAAAISSGLLSRVLTGKRNLGLDVARRLARALEVNLEWLTDGLERVIENGKGEYSDAEIAAARSFFAADGGEMTEAAWDAFMRGMRRKRVATKATIEDAHDPGNALDAARAKKRPRR